MDSRLDTYAQMNYSHLINEDIENPHLYSSKYIRYWKGRNETAIVKHDTCKSKIVTGYLTKLLFQYENVTFAPGEVANYCTIFSKLL